MIWGRFWDDLERFRDDLDVPRRPETPRNVKQRPETSKNMIFRRKNKNRLLDALWSSPYAEFAPNFEENSVATTRGHVNYLKLRF